MRKKTVDQREEEGGKNKAKTINNSQINAVQRLNLHPIGAEGIDQYKPAIEQQVN